MEDDSMKQESQSKRKRMELKMEVERKGRKKNIYRPHFSPRYHIFLENPHYYLIQTRPDFLSFNSPPPPWMFSEGCWKEERGEMEEKGGASDLIERRSSRVKKKYVAALG